MKKVLSLLLCIFYVFSVFAVMAVRKPINYVQPDGSILSIVMHGDEHFSYRSTIDGCFIAKDAQGRYCYVNYMADGTYAMTSVVAHNPEYRNVTEKTFVNTLSREMVFQQYADQRRRIAQRANLSATYPRTGSPRSIVILVNYTDVKFKTDAKEFNRMCNESGYRDNRNQGSCRDFFIAQSDSLFQPVFDVFGPYDLEHNQEWYGGNVGNNNSQRAGDMIVEACGKALSAGVDFTQYDYDDDGIIDNVFVFYAGHGEADSGEENAVWPHRSIVSVGIDFNGKKLRDYACTSELRGGGGMATIGTFCHEFGHVLGLPDYYDTKVSTNETVGDWEIMCSGSYNGPNGYSGATPPSYSAHSRWWLGWRNDVRQLTEPGLYSLAPVEQSKAGAYIIANGAHSLNPTAQSEFFMLENRQQTGWDNASSSLPGTGMLVWHINYNSGMWANNTPNSDGALNYCLLLPNGRDRTGGNRTDTYSESNKRTEFNPVLRDGTNLYQPVFAIKQIGDDMTFVFKSEASDNMSIIPSELDMFHSAFDPQTNRFTFIDVQSIILHSDSIDPSEPVNITTTNGNILLAVDSGKWQTSLKLNPAADSTLSQRLFVGFRPSQMYCEDAPFSGMINIKSGNNQHILAVIGVAPREVKVVPPTVMPIDKITPYSAMASWNLVDDATKYYLTLYQIKDGESSVIQSFEDFDDPSSVSLYGWETNFNRLSTVYKSEGKRSLHFLNSGEYFVTEKYVQPITSISFFHQSFTVLSADEIGHFTLEAFNGLQWDTIESVITMHSSEKATKSFDFDYEKNYIQFRLTYEAYPKCDGTVIDDFIATVGKRINYIYMGADLVVEPTEKLLVDGKLTHTFGNLEPNEEYSFYVQASDEGQGGCSVTITPASEIIVFKTIEGKIGDKDLTYSIDSISYDKREKVIYIPVANDGMLNFYDAYGHLVASVAVAEGQNRVPFPSGNFIHGQLYIVKYSTGRMKRKDRRVTLIY